MTPILASVTGSRSNTSRYDLENNERRGSW